MDEKFLPWADDELVFSDGDWEIWRSDTHGLYCYSVGGVEAACAVDGVQLVEWHMAEPVEYSLLRPWENSGLEYISDVDIMRDFTDTDSDLSERKYIVPALLGKGFLRVNKYYLVKTGLATGDASFAAKVALHKVKSNKYNKDCKPWVTDDIAIVSVPDGVTIKRGAGEGKYILKDRGTIISCSAGRLVEKGYALQAYEIKLAELCESEKVSLNFLKEYTRGFWKCDNPNSIKSLRDIAKLWNELEKGEESALAKNIISHNRNIFNECNKRLEELGQQSTDFDGEIQKLDSAVVRMENDLAGLLAYSNKSVNDNVNGYPSIKAEFESSISRVKDLRDEIYARIASVEEASGGPAGGESVDPFPINILPENLQAQLKDEYESIVLFKQKYDSSCELIKGKLATHKTAIQNIDSKLDDAGRSFDVVENGMKTLEERKKKLDGIVQSLGPAMRKKPSLFAKKKDKDSHIRFLTAVKIVKDGYGVFKVQDKFGTVYVTAAELVYMKLAEYYYY